MARRTAVQTVVRIGPGSVFCGSSAAAPTRVERVALSGPGLSLNRTRRKIQHLRRPGRGNRRLGNKTSPNGQVSGSVGKSRISICSRRQVRLRSLVRTIGRLLIATIDGSVAGRIRQQIGTRPRDASQVDQSKAICRHSHQLTGPAPKSVETFEDLDGLKMPSTTSNVTR